MVLTFYMNQRITRLDSFDQKFLLVVCVGFHKEWYKLIRNEISGKIFCLLYGLHGAVADTGNTISFRSSADKVAEKNLYIFPERGL